MYYYVLDFYYVVSYFCLFFFFKQKTAYEMRISDWSSDVCSSDLNIVEVEAVGEAIKRAVSRSGTRARHAAAAVSGSSVITKVIQIGRASCRERVCQYV